MYVNILWLLLFVSVLDWIAVARSIKKMEYIFKPAVLLVLLLYLYLTTHFINNSLWFAFGICFSLIGDVFLMLPRKQFMTGLVFFLLAHSCYIGGFISFAPQLNLASVIMLLVVSVASFRMYRLITSRKVYFVKRRLKIPVLVYTIAISAMVLSATLGLTGSDWIFIPAFMVSLGAFLFYVSDSIIAVNRYVPGVHPGRIFSMMTYHFGQALIIIGVVYQIQQLVSS